MAQKKRTADKWKKKRWFEVFAPAVLDKKKVAETMAEKPELLMDRVLDMSLRDVTGEIKKGQVYLSMRINNVQGQKAYTVLTGHRILPGQLNRLIRRNNSKVEIVTDITSKDGFKSRVTALTVTARKVPREKRTAIRKLMLSALNALSGTKNQEEMVQDFVFGGTAMGMIDAVKKVAPVKRIEIVKSRPLAK